MVAESTLSYMVVTARRHEMGEIKMISGKVEQLIVNMFNIARIRFSVEVTQKNN